MLLTRRLTCRLVAASSCSLFHRTINTTAPVHGFHPLIADFVNDLKQSQPCFPVAARNIRVLREPSLFYHTLLSMIERANSRIFLSSLYIGSGESELIDALHDALSRSPNLHVHLQLDLNRSTRPGKSSTAHLLLPLLRKFPSRIHVSFFRSPSLRGLMAKLVPPRFNEGWGTWHAKIYGADDEVIISGANLNESYFTNRQDRYIHFSQEPELAAYCFSFLKTVSSFSYQLAPLDSSVKANNDHSVPRGDYLLQWTDPLTHPHYSHAKVHHSFTSLQASYRDKRIDKTSLQKPQSSGDEVLLFPVIQAGQFGVREEEAALDLLFKHLRSHSGPNSPMDSNSRQRPLMDLTSGYFGLYKLYQELILSTTDLDCRIVCASPKANGFYGSSGISGRIPEGYTYLEQNFMEAVAKTGRSWSSNGIVAHGTPTGQGVCLSEWAREGWTYHAKGIWVSPSQDSYPILTLFGSTNLNSRSAEIDTELSFIMALPSEGTAARDALDTVQNSEQEPSTFSLRKELHGEISRLYDHCTEWQGDKREVRWGTKGIVKLVGGML